MDVVLLGYDSANASIPGDHNNDGKVDAADYAKWRKENIKSNLPEGVSNFLAHLRLTVFFILPAAQKKFRPALKRLTRTLGSGQCGHISRLYCQPHHKRESRHHVSCAARTSVNVFSKIDVVGTPKG